MLPIVKSIGQTPTERLLAHHCEQTFLKLWSYPSPFKADGKELCDLLVVFEDRIFLFFDRESRKFDRIDANILLQWNRWKKEVIDKQIITAQGAKNYLLRFPDKVFVDSKCTIELPIPINAPAKNIHMLIVAHGAEDACKAYSSDNVFGSLGICYSNNPITSSLTPQPFMIDLGQDDIFHILDSVNLPILLRERDTITDFTNYIVEKEDAVRRYSSFMYCGEEDLLAHYFLNFDSNASRYRIGVHDRGKESDGIMIGEGEWADFEKSAPYRRRREADQISYLWDGLIQRTGQNAFDGKLLGDGDIFSRPSALREMAKEPRFSRRTLSIRISEAIKSFPDLSGPLSRHTMLLPSFFPETAYVFMQLRASTEIFSAQDYREKRIELLRIACGAAKLKQPHLKKVIGICIDAPRYHEAVGEDFVLLHCDNWTDEERSEYEALNREFKFFATVGMKEKRLYASEFPKAIKRKRLDKVGRNELCSCGSGEKYKKCCLGS